jgi:hypothetical protein
MRLALISALFIIACSDSSGSTTTTGGTTGNKPMDMAGPLSQCGHPGDTGNTKGVGKFCKTLMDCTGMANICSSLGNGSTPSASDTYFCTIYPCTPPDGGTVTDCGPGATCICATGSGGQGGCACTPNSCM